MGIIGPQTNFFLPGNHFLSSTDYFNWMIEETHGLGSNGSTRWLSPTNQHPKDMTPPAFDFRVFSDWDEKTKEQFLTINPDDFSFEMPGQTYGPLLPKNNSWTVVSTIPNDAPPNFTVMATANIDASTLRTRLTDKDLDKRARLISTDTPLGQECYVVYRNGAIRWMNSKCLDLKHLYCFESPGALPFFFDFTCDGQEEIFYLTPTGRAYPSND